MDAKEYWYNVSAPNEDGCMVWMRGKTAAGYGVLTYRNSRWYTHRLAWYLTYGDIPEKMSVCHKCDNPPCCNPEHLFLGTKKDNSQDMAEKDRSPHGERNGQSRLKEEDVRGIHELRLNGWTLDRIGKRYTIGIPSVYKIIVGQRWRRIYDALPYDPDKEYRKKNIVRRKLLCKQK
jgi:hypothetical protein